MAEPFETAPAAVAGLAALMLSLGVTYWLVRDRDDRSRAAAGPPISPQDRSDEP